MTSLEIALRVEGAASIAGTAMRTLGIEQASRELFISTEDLQLLCDGKIDDVGLGSSLVERVAGWARSHNAELFSAAGRPVPPFDHFADYWENFYAGPREERPIHVKRRRGMTRFLDFDLTFPFGVPACAMTPHSGFIDYYARRGFDLLTYKTVRDRPWHAHPFPQWAFAVDPPHDLTPGPTQPPIVTSLDPGQGRQSLINSCGVPSLKPEEWQADVETSKRLLLAGQVLIVSIMGSPEVANGNDAELIMQFANTATLAAEAGADIVEANLSCPNSPGGVVICFSADLSKEILRAISVRLRPHRVPLFAKISFLDEPSLQEFVVKCGVHLEGIVGINTLSVPAVAPSGEPFFGERDRAGLSGPNILSFGLDVTRRLVDLRGRERMDWVVVGVGGVATPSDYDAYMNLGADAVQSCSGSWLNPDLAVEIQERDLPPAVGPRTELHGTSNLPPPIPPIRVASEERNPASTNDFMLEDEELLVSGQLAVLETLELNKMLNSIDLAVATRQSPSQTRRVLDMLLAKQWVEQDKNNVIQATRQGRRAFRNLRRTGASPTAAAPSSVRADAFLDRALVALKPHE